MASSTLLPPCHLLQWPKPTVSLHPFRRLERGGAPARDRQDPQRALRHALGHAENPRAGLGAQRHFPRRRAQTGAGRQDDLRGTLGIRRTGAVPVQGQHGLALRAEGNLGDPRRGGFERAFRQMGLGGEREERSLGRITRDPPAPVCRLDKVGVGAERRRSQHLVHDLVRLHTLPLAHNPPWGA
jgi:hypothetical protein